MGFCDGDLPSARCRAQRVAGEMLVAEAEQDSRDYGRAKRPTPGLADHA
jgi:hypothetical protein